MGYVDDAFVKLKSTLEIGKTEREFAARQHQQIRDHVRATWSLKEDFLTGSYRRETKTKKLKDVDIFVVIDDQGPQSSLRQRGPLAVLEDLASVLRPKYPDVYVDEMACVIAFGSEEEITSFEIVPSFDRVGGGYEIPDTRTGDWISTNPRIHHEMSTAKNTLCDGKFVPFVKMIKGLNRHLDEPVTTSFLLEVMAQGIVMEPFGEYPEEIRWFLATAVEQVHNPWPDPAGLGPDVNTLSKPQRTVASTALARALVVAEKAIELAADGHERDAVEHWRELFGWRMPRP
jgi:predicted nucleotidyltransferase